VPDEALKSALQAVMALELMGSKTSADVLPGMQRIGDPAEAKHD
jgi:hypothetical protein